jgi:hypothetical protein
MGWAEPLPTIAGTVIRLSVEHLPGDRNPKPSGVALTHRTHRYRHRPTMAVVLSPVPPRTHLPLPQTDPRQVPANPEVADHLPQLAIAAHTHGLARDLKHP